MKSIQVLEMPSDNYSEMTLDGLIHELVRISPEWDRQAADAKADVDDASRLHQIAMHMVDRLLWKPGHLVFIPSVTQCKEAELRIDQVWRDEIQHDEELWQKVLYGVEIDDVGYHGVGSDIAFVYAERLRRWKPIVISVNPPTEIRRYFEESVAAWLRGLDCAAIILCWAVVETLMKKALLRIDGALVFDRHDGRECNAARLINNARAAELLSPQEAEAAHHVRELRNNAVHQLQDVDAGSSFRGIIETKQLVERLLT
ncbi:MAG TPA: DUF4145 domain-containing protein [Verrucomicrobiae bacterium]|nr:DUF4145 domain-containing protein [Verrucomicrobiae bacterium]